MDRPDAGEGRQLLSGGREDRRGPAALLRDSLPLVEVDSTYYYPPSEKNSILWIERTPRNFTFNVKAYSLLTNHPTRPESLYADIRESLPEGSLEKRFAYREQLPDEAVEEVWQRFHDALMPLHSAGKLGAVLFQFPQWFTISRRNKAYIEECAERLSDFRVAVEFRHASWMNPKNAEESLSFLASPRSALRLRRHATGFRLERATDRCLHCLRHRHGPLPRPEHERMERQERHRLRAVQVRLRERGARRSGSRRSSPSPSKRERLTS